MERIQLGIIEIDLYYQQDMAQCLNIHYYTYLDMGITVEDIKNFRQVGSLTPGHPEYGHTKGVEITTGPLGQGICNAVGMAMAEAHLAEKFNKADYSVVDHSHICNSWRWLSYGRNFRRSIITCWNFRSWKISCII